MCVFCKIINNEIPSYKVYEDENVIAILDISQATNGHTLVIPKAHFESMLDISEEVLSNVFMVVKKVTKQLEKTLNICDFNILNNVGSVAGQTVNHFHVHIIPRRENDSFNIDFPYNKLTQDEFIELLNRIKIN